MCKSATCSSEGEEGTGSGRVGLLELEGSKEQTVGRLRCLVLCLSRLQRRYGEGLPAALLQQMLAAAVA